MKRLSIAFSVSVLLSGGIAFAQASYDRTNWQAFTTHSFASGKVPPGYSCSNSAECLPTSAPGYAARSQGDCYPGGDMVPGRSFCERIDKNCSLPGTDGVMVRHVRSSVRRGV